MPFSTKHSIWNSLVALWTALLLVVTNLGHLHVCESFQTPSPSLHSSTYTSCRFFASTRPTKLSRVCVLGSKVGNGSDEATAGEEESKKQELKEKIPAQISVPAPSPLDEIEAGGKLVLLEEDLNIEEYEYDERNRRLDHKGEASSRLDSESGPGSGPERRKMDLMWCMRESCYIDELREKVVGKDNDILFDHPATGQVAYRWEEGKYKDTETDQKQQKDTEKDTYTPRVLLLVKRNDDKLLKVAADAVRELTSRGDINIMLPPDVAAKFKHYYAVDNDKIKLFDPKPTPGFGGNHLPSSSHMYNPSVRNENLENVNSKDKGGPSDQPDLVCTLGGDGLLMHASNLFAGPCPPILCIAGGSLGFLTPFSRCEMVDAIRISLGVSTEDELIKNGNDKAWNKYDEAEPPVPHLGRSLVPLDVLNGGSDSGGSNGALQKFSDGKKNRAKVKFGANSQICLSMRMRLECCVINREGVVRARFNVLNEVVIDRGSSPYLAALECFCDDVHLTTVQADGVIFSTPTGSTAYSMAAGGSVVHPAVPAILVTPICPHVLSFRSMVFPDHVVLRCYVPDDARSDAAVAFDGKHRRELHRGDSVQIQMSAYPVPTINRSDHSSDWLTSLKRNFNFNTRARQNPL